MNLPADKAIITDLNLDCALLILEKLGYCDLLSMSQVTGKFLEAAQDVFRRTFGISVRIGAGYTDKTWRAFDGIKSVYLTEFETTLKTLEYFGHLIGKLDIEHLNEMNEAMQIFGSVNRYCSASLTAISIRDGRNLFEKFKVPFPQV